jgi:two-component system KDP operon response regulator KdpE
MLYASTWREGIRMAYEHHPDIILLDIMMPEMDGYEICKRLREMSDVPIIIQTAKSDKNDLLEGFQSGADDFLTKPYNLDELEARIRALLKRTRKRSENWPNKFDDGNLKIDLTKGHVIRSNEQIYLTPTEFQLLSALLRNRGSVMSHRELIKLVWGTGYLMGEGSGKTSLQLYIRYLREKIETDPANPKYLLTKWGVGYWFASESFLDAETLN